jgi:hypothetical protein
MPLLSVIPTFNITVLFMFQYWITMGVLIFKKKYLYNFIPITPHVFSSMVVETRNSIGNKKNKMDNNVFDETGEITSKLDKLIDLLTKQSERMDQQQERMDQQQERIIQLEAKLASLLPLASASIPTLTPSPAPNPAAIPAPGKYYTLSEEQALAIINGKLVLGAQGEKIYIRNWPKSSIKMTKSLLVSFGVPINGIMNIDYYGDNLLELIVNKELKTEIVETLARKAKKEIFVDRDIADPEFYNSIFNTTHTPKELALNIVKPATLVHLNRPHLPPAIRRFFSTYLNRIDMQIGTNYYQGTPTDFTMANAMNLDKPNENDDKKNTIN